MTKKEKEVLENLKKRVDNLEAHRSTCPSCGHCRVCGNTTIFIYPQQYPRYYYSPYYLMPNDSSGSIGSGIEESSNRLTIYGTAREV